MIKYIKTAVAVALVFLMAPTASAQEKPLVLTTTTNLADITIQIAGDTLTVESLATGREDPHFISALPGYIVKARKASAWICIGMDLEVGWEGPILRDSRNRKIQKGASGYIDASSDIIRRDVPQETSRDMGDVHPHGNPHYWLDPLNGWMMAGTICKELSKIFPEHKTVFESNLEKFRLELDNRMFGPKLVSRYSGAKLWKLLIDGKIDKQLETDNTKDLASGWYTQTAHCRGKHIVTYHKSWIYLTERFGVHTAIELEPKPGVPPSPKHLARVVKTGKDQHISLIIQEPFYSRKAADFVAKRTGADFEVISNCAQNGQLPATYLDMLSTAVSTIARKLK